MTKFDETKFNVARFYGKEYIINVGDSLISGGDKIVVDYARDPEDLRVQAAEMRKRADLFEAAADYADDHLETECRNKLYSLQVEFGIASGDAALTWEEASPMTRALIRESVVNDLQQKSTRK